MTLAKAVLEAGIIPGDSATRSRKKAYSERLSHLLADALASALRSRGFRGVKPLEGGPREREFQGGLGPKKVDVSCADERNGLRLAVSIKSICFAPNGKNLKNRFGDLCGEAITLHMRFPYSVVCALFAFPETADSDRGPAKPVSTFRRALDLFATISGRSEYTGPGEKFENVSVLLFRPRTKESGDTRIRLFNGSPDPGSPVEITEEMYLDLLHRIFTRRNPHEAPGLDPEE